MSQQLPQHEPSNQGLKFGVLIAPTRDRNTASSRNSPSPGSRSSSPLPGIATAPGAQGAPDPGPVLIAPTRDRNRQP